MMIATPSFFCVFWYRFFGLLSREKEGFAVSLLVGLRVDALEARSLFSLSFRLFSGSYHLSFVAFNESVNRSPTCYSFLPSLPRIACFL